MTIKPKKKVTKKVTKKKVLKRRVNPRFSKKVEIEIVNSAIQTADSGFGFNEHPIRSAENSAKGTIDYFFRDINYTKKDLEDAFNLYMDVFMYRYFGILKNPKIKKLVDSSKY